MSYMLYEVKHEATPSINRARICEMYPLILFGSLILSSPSICRALNHDCDVITGAMASQITSLTSLHLTVYSGADQRKHQSPASLAFMRAGNSPVTGEFPAQMASNAAIFPYNDVTI